MTYVYEEKDKWYCEVSVFGKRKHRACKGCRNRPEALEFAHDLEHELSLIHRGKLPDNKVITIKEMFDAFLRYSKANKKPKPYSDDEHKVSFFSEYFGAKNPISEITPSKLEGLKTYLTEEKGLTNATFNRYYAVLSKAFNVIILDKQLNIQNPCRNVKKLKEDNQITRYLTEAEEKRLMVEVSEYLKPIVVCALTTGLRLSNILNLKWESINFEQGFIEILKQQNKGHKKIQLPLSSKLKIELEKIGIKKSGYVFLKPNTNIPFKNIRDGFKGALKRAKIDNFRFHDFRHTVATRLVAKGSDLGTVKEYLAHSSLTTTQRYLHATPENMLKAVDILDGF